ncbi:14930_t:CDS:2 [Funneliformis mosseae]|uniref:14930_t:CDS:1 n=1 Tax=Funneliformis mosseae TaxID=27381 RepID=A0A9N9EGK4_FUNMO|nr:14930_t:CDS:2 [Funneliformis mosseae]
MNNFEKGKELEDESADRLDAVGVKNNKNGGDGGIDISGEAAITNLQSNARIGPIKLMSLQGCSPNVKTVIILVLWWRPLDIKESRTGARHNLDKRKRFMQ